MNAQPSVADWVLSVLLAAVACAVTAAILPVRVEPVLRLKLSKNATAISDLDQPRNIVKHAEQWVDVLDLARDGRLAHPKLGAIGMGEHYFLDLKTRVRVPATVSVVFEVQSDDGFALQIDDRRVCAFTKDRALSAQTCRSLLLEGEHDLRLSYFQAGGPAGLAVRYAVNNETTWSWLGENSRHLEFIAVRD